MNKKSAYLLILISLIYVSGLWDKEFINNYYLVNKCPTSLQGGNKELHSQYFEDYILSMVFAGYEKGIYIDVGANDPLNKNVTRYFYEKGWRGINIEPLKKWYDELLKVRPDDINLNIGLSNKIGEVEFFHFTDKEPYSTFNQKVAETHVLERKIKYQKYIVPINTLNAVLAEHPIKEIINFIKIDVEGLEKEVLEGIDFAKFRPQVFVMEATQPSTFIPSHDEWEQILINNNYEFIMFDGLNRYYLAKEHKKELLKNFQAAAKCSAAVNKIYPTTPQVFLNENL